MGANRVFPSKNERGKKTAVSGKRPDAYQSADVMAYS